MPPEPKGVFSMSAWEGGIKNGVIEKLVGELKLQNMIFKAHKNKAKSKR